MLYYTGRIHRNSIGKLIETAVIMAQDLKQVITKARQECALAGVNLTPKRENVLTTLVQAQAPLSAYDIVEQYRHQHGSPLPAMSVYRILDFLVTHRLAHKLETTNQFLACAHIACDHDHAVPQFLICDKCHSVQEVGLRKTLVKELHDSVLKTGFILGKQQLELHGLCAQCQSEK